MRLNHVDINILKKLFNFKSRFAIPCQLNRGKKYWYAVEPKFFKIDEKIDIEDPIRYQPIVPVSKWNHTGHNWDPVVHKICGMLLYDGERETVRDIMRRTFAEIKFIQLAKIAKLQSSDVNSQVESNPIKIIQSAVANCTPALFLHSVRRGGFIYKVPVPPDGPIMARHFSIRWLIQAARSKSKTQRIWVSLAHELIAASNNEGSAIGMKKEHHKQCEENRAYAHYRNH